MLKVYVKSNCMGSKKAEDFLHKMQIAYDKVNVTYQPLDEDEIFIMARLANSVYEIINFNSEEFTKNPTLKDEIMHMSKKDVITYIMSNPNILSYPMALQFDNAKNGKVFIIGFNDNEWTRFEQNAGFNNYFLNFNKSFIFKTCCFFDDVLLDDINLMTKTK